MRRRLTTWLLGGVLALSATAWAQAPPAGEETQTQTTTTTTTTTTEHTSTGHTVRREDVKTWTMTIDSKEYEVHPATPAYEGETGLFHMPTAYTLPKGKFSFSLFRDNLDRDPKDIDISIHGVSLAIGATNKLEIYGNFGVQNRIDADALFQAGFFNDYPFVNTPWQTGVGDLKLGLKYGFLNDYMGDPVGLAIRGFVKIPTADENKGLGTGKTSFGADLILSKNIDEKLDIHGSLGYQWNSDPDSVNIANALKWAVGLNVPACRTVQLQAELMGTKYSGDVDFDQTNPLDLVVGPVFWIKGFFIRPAISWNLNFDDRGLNSSSKSWTGRHISIGWHPGFGCREIETYVPPPPPPPPAANQNPTAVCEIERSEILPGESVRVRANASDPDGDTLTYEWSTSAGHRRQRRVGHLREHGHGSGLVRHDHPPRLGRPGRLRDHHLQRAPAGAGGGPRRGHHVHLRWLPAEPRPPQQRRQGVPGRRGLPPAAGSAQPGDHHRPRRQRRALSRGHRPAARRGGEDVPREGEGHRGVAHHHPQRRRHQAARHGQGRRRPGPEPPGRGDLRPGGRDGTGRLDSHPGIRTVGRGREAAPLFISFCSHHRHTYLQNPRPRRGVL